jgi:WD40 repeat protein
MTPFWIQLGATVKLDLANPDWRSTLPPARSVASDAPAAACAFSRDGKTVAFALGDGRVRLLPADVKEEARSPVAEPLHKGAVLSLIADPVGDGFISGGDDGRLLRIAPDGSAGEIANHKGKWIDKLAAHRSNGTFAASVGKMALVVDKSGEMREFGPHASTVAAVDFSKDGSRIACAHYGGITVWSIGQVTLPPRRFAWQGSHVALKMEHRRQVHRHRHAGERHPCLAHRPGERHAHAGLSRQGEVAVVVGRRALALHLLAAGVHRLAVRRQGPEGKPPLQFGDEGAGLLTVVAAHPAAEFVAGGYDSGELQLGDIKTRRSVVLKMADGSP